MQRFMVAFHRQNHDGTLREALTKTLAWCAVHASGSGALQRKSAQKLYERSS